ncbi:MAG: terminase large subunit [Cytophagales bacterium]|nr:terminase large subunit [Cytophagales bacterium]
MTFIRTTAINKILKLTKPTKGIQGGTSAGKTYGILPIEIDYAIKHPGVHTSVVAESVPHLKRGALKDFKEIMINTKRWISKNWHSTDSIYRFTNGSAIEFFSADNADKLRGGRRDRLYMNEANNMNFEAYTQLAVRTKQSVIMDWNPTSEFWFHTELQNDEDVDFLVINYLDNEACPQSAIDFILKAKQKAETSSYWDNWYKVYGLGQIGSLEGVIFNNWKQIDGIPEGARLWSRGMDFGYTNDPTTLYDVYEWNGKYIIDELLYRTGMVNSDIAKVCKEYAPGQPYIVADSSEPKSIEEIKREGVNIKGSLKGRDSIMHGIQKLQGVDLLVTTRSTNLIKELRNYTWDTDKEGNTLNKPIDAYNHGIDAIRYAFEKLSMPKFYWGATA